jgi:MT-A70
VRTDSAVAENFRALIGGASTVEAVDHAIREMWRVYATGGLSEAEANRFTGAAETRRVEQLVVAPVMEHSRKPDEAHDRIERLVEGPYLELFARRERRGWTNWGDEIAFRMPDGLPHDPQTGEIKEVPPAPEPSSVESPSSPNADDGLCFPIFCDADIRPASSGAANEKTSTKGVVSIRWPLLHRQDRLSGRERKSLQQRSQAAGNVP